MNQPDNQLIAILYQCLQTMETCEVYLQEAEKAGDRSQVEYFRQCQDINRDLAEQARQLLTRSKSVLPR